MKKQLLVPGLLLLCASTSQGFSLSDITSFFSGDDPAAYFQSQAPADTLMYMDGRSANSAGQMVDLEKAQLGLYEVILSMAGEDGQLSPQLKLYQAMMDRFFTAFGSGDEKALAQAGLTPGFYMAMYMDGFAPVLQLEVDNRDKFLAEFTHFENAGTAQFSKENWNGTDVYTLPLVQEENVDIRLAVTEHDGYGSIGLFAGNDSDERKMRRLGLADEKQPLAGTDRMATMRDRHGFDEHLAGFIDLVNIARTVLKPSETGAGQDLQQLFPGEISQNMSEVCNTEILSLVSSAPQISFGYNNLSTQAGHVELDTSLIWEMKSGRTLTDLQKLNGHLATGVTGSDEQILGIGLGLNMSQLAPVLTSLWTDFTQTTYQCPQLKELQQQAAKSNPAMVGMVTAMAQGVKGAAVQLFDADVQGDVLKNLDAAVSVAAEDPAVIAAMAGSLPMFAGITIPADGTPVDVNLPLLSMFAPDVKVKAAIKGKYLVMYSGQAGEKAAISLGSEKLNSAGILSGYMNYPRMGKLAEKFAEAYSRNSYADSQSCAGIRQSVLSLQSADMKVHFTQGFDQQGLFIRGKGILEQSAPSSAGFQPGTYSVEMLGDGCQWEADSTVETLKADGTGGYIQQDDNGECPLLDVAYTWKKTGPMISFSDTHSRSRDNCTEEFREGETDQYSCLILNTTANGFECLYGAEGDDEVIYRFTRK